jgi:hypothetical protein
MFATGRTKLDVMVVAAVEAVERVAAAAVAAVRVMVAMTAVTMIAMTKVAVEITVGRETAAAAAEVAKVVTAAAAVAAAAAAAAKVQMVAQLLMEKIPFTFLTKIALYSGNAPTVSPSCKNALKVCISIPH